MFSNTFEYLRLIEKFLPEIVQGSHWKIEWYSDIIFKFFIILFGYVINGFSVLGHAVHIMPMLRTINFVTFL